MAVVNRERPLPVRPGAEPGKPIRTGAEPPPPAEPPAKSYSALKEWTTALIGAAIVAVTLWMAAELFGDRAVAPVYTQGSPPTIPPERYDPFTRGKDILLILLPLAGAIVGYYTGRVIAERTVQQANNTTRQATETAREANLTAQSVRSTSRTTLRQALSALESLGSTEAAPREEALKSALDTEDASVGRARREIRRLLDDLGG